MEKRSDCTIPYATAPAYRRLAAVIAELGGRQFASATSTAVVSRNRSEGMCAMRVPHLSVALGNQLLTG